MNQIKAAIPHVDPNTVESAVRRLHERERLIRISPGVYRLRPEKTPEPAKPASPEPDPVRSDDDQQRLNALEADRLRKRQERARQRAEAAARQAEADAALLAQLIDAAGGNVIRTPELNDLAPIRLALTLVPIDIVLLALRKIDPKLNLPDPPPLHTWHDQALLQRIAQYYCRFVAVPSMVAAWSQAGTAPQKPARTSNASAATPDPAAPEEDRTGSDSR